MAEVQNSDNTKTSLLTDIQALLAVKESYESDVRNLNNARLNTQGLVDSAKQELKSVQQRILSEEQSWGQRKTREYGSLDSRLKQREANLDALERQLRTREAAVADVEAVKASYERKDYDLNSKSLQIEQIRMALIEKNEQADSLLRSMGNDRQALTQGLKELEKQKDAHRVEVNSAEELRAVLEKRKEELNLREQTVSDALKGLGPKMKEIEEREKALQESTEKVRLDTSSIKEREKFCEDHERRLEERHKIQEELQARLHAEEVKYRKKGLELVDWEHSLDAKEKLLEKREKAISGAKKEESVKVG